MRTDGRDGHEGKGMDVTFRGRVVQKTWQEVPNLHLRQRGF